MYVCFTHADYGTFQIRVSKSIRNIFWIWLCMLGHMSRERNNSIEISKRWDNILEHMISYYIYLSIIILQRKLVLL